MTYFPGGGGGADTFLELTDAPDSYTGEAGQVVKVNVTEDGLEFATDLQGAGGEGDYASPGVEQALGYLWHDGLTVHRMVVTDTLGTGAVTNVNLGLTTADISEIIDIRGVITDTNSGNPRWYPINLPSANSAAEELRCRVENNAGSLRLELNFTGSFLDNEPFFVIVYYTKIGV